MIQKNKKNRMKGFTVLELLVVIFIIGLLSALVLANYRDSQKKYNLSQSAQVLASDIRKAQNMAIGGMEDLSLTDPHCAYCLHFSTSDTGSYKLFADNDNSSLPSGLKCNYKYVPSPPHNDEVIETIDLPSQIKIQSLDKDGSSQSELDLCFAPPKPETYINDDISNSEATIILHIDGSSDAKTIKLNTAGLITVD